MDATSLAIVLLLLSAAAYFFGRRRALRASSRGNALHSRPSYHGLLVALWCALPAIVILLFGHWLQAVLVDSAVSSELSSAFPQNTALELSRATRQVSQATSPDALSADLLPAFEAAQSTKRRVVLWRTLAVFSVFFAGLAFALRRIQPRLRARNQVETFSRLALAACSAIAILTTVGIVLSMLFEALRFFHEVPITQFLFGTSWSPQMALREDQVGSSGAFGAVPLFAGTLLISLIAMVVAVPIGLLAAIYLAEYASAGVRNTVKPLLEILAGIPTVVYGFFAALTVAPALRGWGASMGLEVSSESALTAGLVMGIMIIPFVSSLSDDVINAVPRSLRDGSLSLGATRSETMRKVIFPAALPGVVGGILLAVSRAIGETMIVVMAAGLAANLTANPLESVTTVTVQIVTLLVGDQEFDSPKTLAAFALGLMLFVITLILNMIALYVVRRYREQYE